MSIRIVGLNDQILSCLIIKRDYERLLVRINELLINVLIKREGKVNILLLQSDSITLRGLFLFGCQETSVLVLNSMDQQLSSGR